MESTFQRFANNPFLKFAVKEWENKTKICPSWLVWESFSVKPSIQMLGALFYIHTISYHTFPNSIYFLRELNIKNGSFFFIWKTKQNKGNLFLIMEKTSSLFVQIYIFQDLIIWTEMTCNEPPHQAHYNDPRWPTQNGSCIVTMYCNTLNQKQGGKAGTFNPSILRQWKLVHRRRETVLQSLRWCEG